MKVLVTGAAGFIGMHCAKRLLERGDEVAGVDNLSPYYSVQLKKDRLAQLKHPKFGFSEVDIADSHSLGKIFEKHKPETVLHLAAQPGVRYSLENPGAYIQSNLVGFANLLECCRRSAPRHLVFASSSSVYGSNPKLPWSEVDNVDRPVSLYAATKKANELMAHAYSHLYGFPATGLRFFTVYGPWGRPDMAYFSFTQAILAGRPIDVYNHGQLRRDFTYIDDIVTGVVGVLDNPPPRGEGAAPYRLYNIGNSRSESLMDFIGLVEQSLGKKAEYQLLPMQPLMPGKVTGSVSL